MDFSKGEIYISETQPSQEGLKVWIKPIEEQIEEESNGYDVYAT